MKNLLNKIKNLRLFKETKGEIILATIVVMGVLLVVGQAAEYVATLQPHTYAAGENREGDATVLADESATSLTIIEEDKPAEFGTIVINRDSVIFGKYGSGDPDPTLNNKFNEEVVLPPNEESAWGNKSLEEIFGADSIEYVNGISQENKQNHNKENESDKISDDKTKQQLTQNQLPDDKLSIDIYNSITNLVSENIKSGQLDDIGNISAQLFKDFLSKGEETLNSEEDVIKNIKDDLNEKKLLAEEEVISKRKYVKLLQQAKEEYEQRVAVIDKLGPDSVWTQNLIDYKNDKRIIEDLNTKISEADDFINNYEAETAGENTDQPASTSETEQTTTSSDTSITDQNATSSTDLATTTSGSSTTTSGTTTTTSGSTTTTAGTTTTTTNSELPEYISMYGSIGGYSNSMNLSIDLITGNVSGGINLVYSQVETSGDTSMTCTYSIKGNISGQMDLETRQISGSFSGRADPLTEGCYGKDLSYSISGKLNENYSSASGSSSNGWSWSVYK